MRFEIHQADDDLWHWRLVMSPDRVVGRSENGYASADRARRAVRDITTEIQRLDYTIASPA